MALSPTPPEKENLKTSSHSKKKPSNKAYLHYSGLAFQMGATIFLGAFAGRKLDNFLEFQHPVFTVMLALAGVAVAVYFVIKDVTKDG